MKNIRRLALILLLIFLLSFPKSALAHRDDYIDETLVYLTLEKKKLNPNIGWTLAINTMMIPIKISVSFAIISPWNMSSQTTG